VEVEVERAKRWKSWREKSQDKPNTIAACLWPQTGDSFWNHFEKVGIIKRIYKSSSRLFFDRKRACQFGAAKAKGACQFAFCLQESLFGGQLLGQLLGRQTDFSSGQMEIRAPKLSGETKTASEETLPSSKGQKDDEQDSEV